MSTQKLIRAFTLLELLAVIAVLVILMLLVVPSFQSIIQNNRTVSLSNELISALNFARSESIKRGVSVSLCAAADVNLNSCGSNWNNGWLVFVNPNEDAAFANNATEILLRIQQILGQGYSVTTTPALGVATYTSSGFPLAATGNMVFNITATGCTGNNARSIRVTTTGRLNMTPVACP